MSEKSKNLVLGNKEKLNKFMDKFKEEHKELLEKLKNDGD